MRSSKPSFQAVVDLGLRDVGVQNDRRRLAANLGKTFVQVMALFLSVSAIAITAAGLGATWIVVPLMPAAVVLMALRVVKRAPLTVLKIDAADRPVWSVLLAPTLALGLLMALSQQALMIPIVGLVMVAILVVRRVSGRVPEVLRRLRPLLAADEAVLGDGLGQARGARGWRDAFRLIVATDRRLLVVGASDGAPLVDAPYDRVSRFGVEWKQWGRAGELSLDVEGADGEPPETHVIASIVPANLVSIMQALQSHGVQADDPAAVAEAERGWEQARRPAESHRRGGEWRDPVPGRMPKRPDFDRGLWMFLRLAAGALYVNAFGVGLGTSRDPALLLLVLPVVCGVCGYVAGTKRSIAYLVPLNLLVSPAFFFADAGDVIGLMLVLSVLATVGLLIGSALGRARRRRLADAEPEPAPRERPPRGSLQEVLSGPGLIRLSGIVLAGILTLVVASAAAGFELGNLRLAIQEWTGEQRPVDGRSNLTGNAASLTYTPGPDLRELITDHAPEGNPTDGARWELRSKFTQGANVVSLASYTYEQPLDDSEAVASFVARKDVEHAALAGSEVTHTERVVDGRRGYVWNHGSPSGYWYYAAWFPHRGHTVRVECIARRQEDRFRRLCAEAVASLEFRRP